MTTSILWKQTAQKNNHRSYDDEQLEDIWQVMVLKETGFELEEIKSLIHSDNISKCLQQKQNDVQNEINSLMEKMNFIAYILKNGFPEKPQSNYKEAIQQIIKDKSKG